MGARERPQCPARRLQHALQRVRRPARQTGAAGEPAGGPANSGVYIQDRYEANINEMYGRLDGNPCAGFDNCTPASARPGIRASRPPLEWQTLDIDFHAPKFDAAGNKTASARVTMLFNGATLYDNRELGPVTLNAARLGEAATGPIQLQEHGMPLQFRNVWLVETGGNS